MNLRAMIAAEVAAAYEDMATWHDERASIYPDNHDARAVHETAAGLCRAKADFARDRGEVQE